MEFLIKDELKLFNEKSVNDYEIPLNDLYDSLVVVENKMKNIDKVSKKSLMNVELFKEELEEKNKQISCLKKELINVNNQQERFAKKVLLILDQIENIYRFAEKSENLALVNNLKTMIYIIKNELIDIGFEEIPTIGARFNSELHECIEAIEDNTKNKYEIIDVVKKGYKMNGKILRIASVIAIK